MGYVLVDVAFADKFSRATASSSDVCASASSSDVCATASSDVSFASSFATASFSSKHSTTVIHSFISDEESHTNRLPETYDDRSYHIAVTDDNRSTIGCSHGDTPTFDIAGTNAEKSTASCSHNDTHAFVRAVGCTIIYPEQ